MILFIFEGIKTMALFGKWKEEEGYAKLEQLFLRNADDQAFTLGEDIHTHFPTHIPTMLLLARLHLKHNHFDKAHERYTKILVIDALHTDARLGRAEASLAEDETEDALLDYLQLYETSFNTTSYLIALGHCFEKINLHQIAHRYYEKAVNQSPWELKALVAFGNHLMLTGQWKSAQVQCLRAKKIYYDHPGEYDTSLGEEITQLENELKQLMMPQSMEQALKKNVKKKTTSKTVKKAKKGK